LRLHVLNTQPGMNGHKKRAADAALAFLVLASALA
jgi:hypothetical protein